MKNKSEIKVGDVVICVNTKSISGRKDVYLPPLKLKGEYIVQAIKMCPCGRITYDVGLAHNKSSVNLCLGCSRGVIGDIIWWCAAERFIKKDTRSIDEQIAEAVEIENYELAKELTEKKNNK